MDRQTSVPGQRVMLISTFLSRNTGLRQVSEELAVRLEGIGWNVQTTSALNNKYLRPVDMALRVLRRRATYDVANIDVFSGPAFRWAELTGWLLSGLRKPFIATLHGGNLPHFSQTNASRVRKLLGRAAAVTAPSGYLASGLAPFHRHIRIIPNALDVSSYRFEIRSTRSPTILWLRSFHSIYNPTLAPQTLAIVKREFANVTLLMVGPDKDGSLARTVAATQLLGLSDSVKIIPGVGKSEVPSVMNQADIFLNTANIDNTPVSVIEAMASGLCVVSTRVGGVPYLINDGIDGLLVQPGDPESMATAVCRLLRDGHLASRLACSARAKVAKFDWTHVLSQWDSILREVAWTSL